jgi:two-component system, response regulator
MARKVYVTALARS